MSVNEDDLDKDGLECLERETHVYRKDGYPHYQQTINFMKDKNLILFLDKARFRVLDVSTQTVIAASTYSFPFSHPKVRGRGIVSEVLRIVDDHSSQLPGRSYSPRGLMNRVRTHRLHVQAAVDRDEDIPQHVKADYDFMDGKVKLNRNFDVNDYLEASQKTKQEEARKNHTQNRSHLLKSFQKYIDGRGAEIFSLYDGNGSDYQLAVAIKVRHGGVIRVTNVEYTQIYQNKIDGSVVDAYGIRPEKDAFADLVDRLCLMNMTEDVHVYQDISACPKPNKPVKERPHVPGVEDILGRVSAGLAALRLEIETTPDMEMVI